MAATPRLAISMSWSIQDPALPCSTWAGCRVLLEELLGVHKWIS